MGSLTVGRMRGGFVIRLNGHGTLRESRALTDFLALASERSRCDLDLRQADWLDSTFLGGLMAQHKRLNRPGEVRFRICASPEQVHKLFGRTRLDTVLPQATEPDPAREPEEHLPEAALDATVLTAFVADCHRRLAELGGPDSAAYSAVADALTKTSR